MAMVTLDLPSEVFSALRRSPEEFVAEMRLAAAIYWYGRGEMSQSKAAAVAGLSRVAFLDELARRQVEVFQVNPEDLRRELDRG